MEAVAREMHMDGASAWIVATQAVAGTGGSHQLALRGFGTKAISVNDNLCAQRNAVLVLEHLIAHILGCGVMGDLQRISCTE